MPVSTDRRIHVSDASTPHATSRSSSALLLALVTVGTLLAPVTVEAQVRRGRNPPPTPPWAPITLGVRGGWEQEQIANGGMLGAEARIPVVRDGRFEVVPSFDAVFLNVQTEYQYNVDAVFVPGRRRGGVFFGGGVAWRESLVAGLASEGGKDTYFGYNIVLGGKGAFGPLQAQIGIRWSLLTDTSFDPSALMIGLSFPLWSAMPQPRR